MVESNEAAGPRPVIVGRYALFDEIAAGGMATIHLGRLVGPVGFSRTVAIKKLHPQFAKDPEFVGMFLEEARLASRIQHPNVISTVDVATTEESDVFLVMEYVAGESLAKVMRNALKAGAAMPLPVAGTVLSGMLHGLHATHEAKNENLEPMHIVHRDVSPQNVLVGVDGVARIFDFGVAKAAAMRSQATSDGQMKGKLSYMSPEQLNSKEVDRRTDVFAAGIVAWECLVGKRLFAGSDPGEVLAKVLTLEIPSPNSVHDRVPTEISDIVMRALQRDPSKRWQSAKEFAVALEQAGPLAAFHQVGAWVAEHAQLALEDREQRVAAVERASISLSAPPADPATSSSAAAAAVSGHASKVGPSPSGDLSHTQSGTARASTLSVNAPLTPDGEKQSWWTVVLLAGAAATVAAGLWYWDRQSLDSARDAASGTIPALDLYDTGDTPPSTHQGESASQGETRNPEPAPSNRDSELPPPVEVGSLPEQDAAAEAPPAEPRGTPEVQPRRAAAPRRAPSKLRQKPTPSAPPPKAAPTPQQKPEQTGAQAPARPSSACDPPWYVDQQGIRRLKDECI